MTTVIPFDPNRPRKGRTLKPVPADPTPVEICDNLEPYRIAQARGINGWTRADLAERVGVTERTVAAWEFGGRKLRPEELQRIAEVTGYPPPFFRNGRPMARLDSSEVFICGSDR